MGVEFFYNEDGTHYRIGDPETGCYNLKAMKMPAALRKYALSVGVEIVDRVMMTDLLTKEGAVVGAVGISTDEGEFAYGEDCMLCDMCTWRCPTKAITVTPEMTQRVAMA